VGARERKGKEGKEREKGKGTAAPPRPLKIGNRALSFQACVFCKFNQYVFVGAKTPFYLQMDGWIDR